MLGTHFYIFFSQDFHFWVCETHLRTDVSKLQDRCKLRSSLFGFHYTSHVWPPPVSAQPLSLGILWDHLQEVWLQSIPPRNWNLLYNYNMTVYLTLKFVQMKLLGCITINPLSPNIHMQILQTDLYTFS